MKKLILATAIAALSISASNAAPTIYGKIFITADYINTELERETADSNTRTNTDSDSVQINSNTSRIGLKGSEPITANTDVIYQLDYGIVVDGEDRNLNSRDTYLGLTNQDVGQFRFGRNYSVIDYINNVSRNEGYWDNIGASSSDDDSVASALTLTDGTRINNSIVWIAPKYNDLPLELALQYGADESLVSNSDERDSGFGASLFFDAGTGFTAGIAYDKDMSISNTNDFDEMIDPITEEVLEKSFSETTGGDILRVTASADLGKYMAYPITLSGLYQQADYDYRGAKEEEAFVISADMMLTNFARPMQAYIQYDKTNNVGGIDSLDSDQIVVGGKYEYKDNIIAHGYAGFNSADSDDIDADVFAIGGGLEYLF